MSHFEGLEGRVLFAASANSPHTVAGLVIEFTITGGTGIYESSGGFELRFALDQLTYQNNGDSGTSEGTYVFGRPSASALTVRATDDISGNIDVATLRFTSLTGGTYGLLAPGLTGSQSGTFKVTGTITSLVEIVGSQLNILGTLGDDVITVSKVKTKLYVTQNNWTTAVSAGSINKLVALLRQGNDSLRLGTGVPAVYCDASSGNDSVLGGDGKDSLTGGSGKDTLNGGANDDRLNGSGNNDSITGDAGNDRLYGGDGNDILIGGGNVDRLYGGAGADVLTGGASNDKLHGEGGNDTLTGNAGADLLDGGDGTDTANSDSLDSLVSI